MAFVQIGNQWGISKPFGQDINGGDDSQAGYGTNNYITLAAIRARLTALDGTIYSAANLNKLSFNDMQYALTVLGG